MVTKSNKAVTGRNEKKPKEIKLPKDKILSRLTVFFFDKPRLTALLWIALTIFGALSYTTFMRREGFPSVNVPIAIVGGAYFVNDPAVVDANVAGPIADIALKQSGVSKVESQAQSNFFTVAVTFKDGTNAKTATKSLEQAVKDSGKLPESANVQFNPIYFGATGGGTEQLDIAISFYPEGADVPLEQLTIKAEEAAEWLNAKEITSVNTVSVQNPFEDSINPATGEAVTFQKTFDRFGFRENDQNTYHRSVILGIAAKSGFDVIELDNAVRTALDELHQDSKFEGFNAEISASSAPQIKANISELQKSLLEGLLAILVVGSIVIAIRASIITVISMITVVAITLGFLYVIGYSLNVITLFALILALALIVDDTIIMVEAIDAARHHHKDRRRAIQEATRKVSRAMVAATATAALSFVPLLFVGGILGEFIRAIPVTIIASLVISLIVALLFIPFFARFLLLGPKQMGKKGVTEVAAGFEAKIANFITGPMLWARHSRTKLFTVGSVAVFIGLSFIVAGILIGRNVDFNIFPPTKDTNGLVVSLSLPPGLTIEEAEAKAADADKIVADSLNENFVQGSYFASGSEQGGAQSIEIISYTKREVRSPELVNLLQTKLTEAGLVASVSQSDVGPPSASFVVQIAAENRDGAFKAAEELKTFLTNTELKRPNGTTARFENATVSSPNQFIRVDGMPVLTVSAGFDGDDTSTLVNLGETALNNEFTAEKIASFGLQDNAIKLELGQESENQESFATLAIAFPLLLVVMFLLLAIQFRSLLQPLLIFMAIPFSFFGIALGLSLTNNSFSFFAALGFFAILGLSVKNTILLTDFANQAHKAGMGPVDSAVAALRERFRPLFATSATAVVSLIPLALTSPFWEGLTVTLIFGLLSSTFLVIAVFPYYYLGSEYLRLAISRKLFFGWLAPTLAITAIVWWLVSPVWGLLVIPLSLAVILFRGFYAKRLVS